MGTNRTPKGFGSSSGKERKSRVGFSGISPPTRNRDLIVSKQTMAFAEIRILLNLKNNLDGKQKTHLMSLVGLGPKPIEELCNGLIKNKLVRKKVIGKRDWYQITEAGTKVCQTIFEITNIENGEKLRLIQLMEKYRNAAYPFSKV